MTAMRDRNSKGDVDLTISWNRGLTICSFFFIKWDLIDIIYAYCFPSVFVPAGNKNGDKEIQQLMPRPLI